MTLGEQISRHRKDLGISQEELGARLGVSWQAVSKWETGKSVPDMENLMALATLFGVPLPVLSGTPPEKTGCLPKEMAETQEAPPVQGKWSGPRLGFVLIFAVMALVILLAAFPVLLLSWNRVSESEQSVELILPAEATGEAETGVNSPAQDRLPDVPSDAEKVYRAFNQLSSGGNLTAEERYAYRRDLFACLPDMDWAEFGRLGTTDEESDCIFALMDFLSGLEDYSDSELYRLQRASVAKGIDGAYAEYYSGVLSGALLRDPAAFVRQLAYDDGSGEPWPYHAVSAAAYDLTYFPEKTVEVEKNLETALSDGSFTKEQSGWCRLLLLYLEGTEDGDQSGLPKSPEELRD